MLIFSTEFFSRLAHITEYIERDKAEVETPVTRLLRQGGDGIWTGMMIFKQRQANRFGAKRTC